MVENKVVAKARQPSTKPESSQAQSVRIGWKIVKTRTVGHSEPMGWARAMEWAFILNAVHAGRIEHWIE